MKKNIALLSGGDSSERVISIQSGAQIAQAIDGNKYNLYQIDLQGRDWSYTADDGAKYEVDKNDFSVTVDGHKRVFDYALILIHGRPGEDGRLQGYLDMMGVPYSSCGVVSSAVTFDKRIAKLVVAAAGIKVAREVYVRRGEVIDSKAIVASLGLPMFVKPNASGSSFGVTKVKNEAEIIPAIEAAFLESDAVLLEEFLEGREFGCGVMVAGERELLLPVTEIVSSREFFDYKAKYTAGLSDEITPANISAELTQKIQSIALQAYKACDCRGIVRIDFIVRAGEPYLVELNTVPGMSGGSIVPKQAAAAGISLAELFDLVIESTLKKR